MSERRLFHVQLAPGRVVLSRDESHHAATVLRCRTGEAVRLFDGRGREAAGRVVEADARGTVLEVGEVVELPDDRGVRLTLAVAMPRRPRQPYLFEKCTELGVREIWPTIFARSVVKPHAEQVGKWRRTTIEAAKQCGRCRLPEIESPLPFEETLGRSGRFDASIVTDVDPALPPIAQVIAACEDPTRARTGGSEGFPGGLRLLVWIGPEGGLTAEEVSAAVESGAHGAGMGGYALRVETAAVSVAALLALGSQVHR